MRWPAPDRLERLLDALAGRRLLVLGDVVLDEYLWGEAERMSPEAPVPVVHVSRESQVLGGAGNVVRNIAALGAHPEFCTVVGDDSAGRRVRELLEALDVDPAGLVVEADRPTTRKTRVVARSQQVVRFDRETVAAIEPRTARGLVDALERAIPRSQGVILEDYGKGLLSPSFLRQAMRRFAGAGLPVSVDPKGDLRVFRGAALVKPNLREAEALSGIAIRGPDDLRRAAERLRRALPGASVVVTRGGEGMTLFGAGEDEGIDVRTPPREVFDVQGAGDTAIAVLSLALRAGASLLEAALLANAAAGVVVGKVGTATANPEEVRAQLPAVLDAARKGP
jgi:rfaE bifunctional protein kinase chain/domain